MSGCVSRALVEALVRSLSHEPRDTDMKCSKKIAPLRPVRRIRGVNRAGPATTAAALTRRQADWYRQDALASGIRVKILMRMRAHPDHIYQAACEAAHSAAEWQRTAAAEERESEGARDARPLGCGATSKKNGSTRSSGS